MFEIAKPEALDKEQITLIQKHLSLVFIHEIDPSYPDSDKLNIVHNKKEPNKKDK